MERDYVTVVTNVVETDALRVRGAAPDRSIYCLDCIDPAENWLEKVAEEIRTGNKHIWISIRSVPSNRINLTREHAATANTEKNNTQNISKSKCRLKVVARCRR